MCAVSWWWPCGAVHGPSVVVEIVDTEATIDAFLSIVDEPVTEGLVTVEAVRVLRYASRERG
jgi:PII-like signaling protein